MRASRGFRRTLPLPADKAADRVEHLLRINLSGTLLLYASIETAKKWEKILAARGLLQRVGLGVGHEADDRCAYNLMTCVSCLSKSSFRSTAISCCWTAPLRRAMPSSCKPQRRAASFRPCDAAGGARCHGGNLAHHRAGARHLQGAQDHAGPPAQRGQPECDAGGPGAALPRRTAAAPAGADGDEGHGADRAEPSALPSGTAGSDGANAIFTQRQPISGSAEYSGPKA